MSAFISYSRANSNFADLLYRLLTSKGYFVWIDRQDIQAGGQWDWEIQQAIDASDCVIVILTPDSAKSPNVADEWSYAFDRDKKIIPLLYQDCDVPMRLRRVQRIDFISQIFDEAFRELTQTLGTPENRPIDPIELAKREGLIFVDTLSALGIAGLRIAFDYNEYPQIGIFLNVVWQTLLWRSVDAHTYGQTWHLKNKATGREYIPDEKWSRDTLLHNVGVEPGDSLTVILLDETARLKGRLARPTV